MVNSETETFTYDFLDRLTGVSGPYSESYAYNSIGNITSKNGNSYTYGDNSHKHAVTAVAGGSSYAYDANGNMTTRGSQTLTWDAENRTTSVNAATFIYDGNGARVKKTESGVTTLYLNKYYEKNLTSGDVTTYYYLGDRLVAKRANTTMGYVHQDHLTGTSLTTDSSGAQTGSIKYFSFGATRSSSGTLPDQKFTGQRLDGTGLYYYGARYYDPQLGRFISPDTFVPNPANPQSLNRYSYVYNNPLKYSDPTGNWPSWDNIRDVAGAVWAGLEVATSKSVEYYLKVGEAVHTGMDSVDRGVVTGLKTVQETMNNLPNTVLNAIGIEGVTTLNTSLVQDVPLIDVREGSLLDKALFFTDGAVTLYPIGVFTNNPLSDKVKEHEGVHWDDQESWGPFVGLWYSSYIFEYGTDLILYGGNADAAHDANSFEREAYNYPPAAGTGADPGPPWDYWDW